MKAAAFGLCLCLTATLAGQSQVPKFEELTGATAPALVKEVKPAYTADTLRAGVQGTVKLECVVNVDGTVGDVQVIGPLDPGLDAEAVQAMKQWLFKPATKDGVAVAVRVQVEMAFAVANRGPRLDSAEVFKPDAAGLTLPTVLSEVKPAYPPDMIASAIAGTVGVRAVVLPDGTVGDMRVTKELHPALDREAMRALRRWRFLPGSVDGKAVPVQVDVELSFTTK